MSVSKPCSTCRSVGGICTCTGCKLLFCPPHFNDHRQQMSVQLEQIMQNCHQLEIKTKDTIQTQRSGSSVLSEIDKWQRSTIEKVTQVAENARQQVIQLMRRKKTEILEKLDLVGKEIRTRQSANDFVEYDLERLKEAVNKLQKDLDQYIRQPLELHIKGNDQIDWNNLIYIEQRYVPKTSRNFQEPPIRKIFFFPTGQ